MHHVWRHLSYSPLFHFALSNELHVRICERYQKFLGVTFSKTSKRFSLTWSTWCVSALFHRRKNEKRVRLWTEVEVLRKWAQNQEGCINLHLEEVILLLPNKWNAFEFAQSVSLGLDTGLWWHFIIRLSQHKVEYKLLTPQDNAFNNVQGKHAQAV